jgi:Flp pilus assembly protein TadG
VVDLVLVMPLLLMLVAGVLQLALALHARNTLSAAAAEGARAAVLSGGASAGAARAQALVAEALPAYDARVEVRAVAIADRPAVEVVVSGPLPVVGPWGPSGALRGVAHSFGEEPS